jgi:hypothetical protein
MGVRRALDRRRTLSNMCLLKSLNNLTKLVLGVRIYLFRLSRQRIAK